MLQDVFAGLGRIGGVNARRHASRHPRSLETEIVLGRVESDHGTHVVGLQSELQQRLGEPTCLSSHQSKLHGFAIVILVRVRLVVLADNRWPVSPLGTILAEHLRHQSAITAYGRDGDGFGIEIGLLVAENVDNVINLRGSAVSHFLFASECAARCLKGVVDEIPTEAKIAQLGERMTEDHKVRCSIHLLGAFLCPPF